MKKLVITKIVLTALLCVVISNKAMENYKDKNKGNIKSESDIALFISKVVAYQFCSYEFPKGHSPWDEEDYYSKFNSKFNELRSMIHYGYVEDKGFGDRSRDKSYMLRWGLDEEDRWFLSSTNKDYIVHTLLKVHSCLYPITYFNKCGECEINAMRNRCPNPSKILHSGHFYGEVGMRNITSTEAIDILKAVNGKNARFSYWIREDFSLPNILDFLEQLKG